MRVICISVNDDSYVGIHSDLSTSTPRLPRSRQHLSERGVSADFFHGVHGPKLGIETKMLYDLDTPGNGFNIGSKPTGCWLSHRALWAACLLLSDDLFLIIEDDAKFPEDWRDQIDRAISDAGDFDILYVGSCCTEGKPARHVAGNVYEVRWPLCTHGYIVRRSAIETLISTQDAAGLYAPIDISMALHSLPKMKTLIVRPRILEQFDTEIPP